MISDMVRPSIVCLIEVLCFLLARFSMQCHLPHTRSEMAMRRLLQESSQIAPVHHLKYYYKPGDPTSEMLEETKSHKGHESESRNLSIRILRTSSSQSFSWNHSGTTI